jgi:hypothetical protein
MIAKALDERYQSAAEIARGLRECEHQVYIAPSATNTLPLTALAPRPTPAVVATDVKAAVLAQTVERSRRAQDETPQPDAAPVRGLSRTFDSLEATQRLVALSDTGKAVDPDSGTMPLALQNTGPASGGWNRRDTAFVAAGAIAGLIVAAIIVLT